MTAALSVAGVLIFALLFALAGIGAVWWGLFGDKPRGRRRCPRCWHDLSFTPGLVCGECGRVAQDEADLGRTRRRWGAATASLLIILAVTGWVRLEVMNTGWTNVLPDAVLIGLSRFAEPPGAGDAMWQELERRVWQGELSPEALRELAATLVAMRNPDGSVRAAPATLLRSIVEQRPGVLEPKPGMAASAVKELDQQYRQHLAALDAILSEAPLAVHCELPAAWPAGVTPVVRIHGMLLGTLTEWRARVEGTDAPWMVWNSDGGMRLGAPRTTLDLPAAAADAPEVRARILLETRRYDRMLEEWSGWTPEPPLDLQRTVAWIADPPLSPDASARLERQVTVGFRHPVTVWEDEQRPVALRYGAGTFASPTYSDLLVGVIVELREGDQVRRRTRFWWHGGNSIPEIGWATEEEDLPALRRLAATMRVEQAAALKLGADLERRAAAELVQPEAAGPDPAAAKTGAQAEELAETLQAEEMLRVAMERGLLAPGWTLSIRGDRLTALRALPFTASTIGKARWWSGSIEQPLRVDLAGTPAPPRALRREPVIPDSPATRRARQVP